MNMETFLNNMAAAVRGARVDKINSSDSYGILLLDWGGKIFFRKLTYPNSVAGRYKVSLYLPKFAGHGKPLETITINPKRKTSDVLKDIERRLLSDYRELFNRRALEIKALKEVEEDKKTFFYFLFSRFRWLKRNHTTSEAFEGRVAGADVAGGSSYGGKYNISLRQLSRDDFVRVLCFLETL